MPAITALGLAAALLAAGRRSDGSSSALGLAPGPPVGRPLVVFVPGHGQGEPAEVFNDLIDMMGLQREDVAFFDYRLAGGWGDPVGASEGVGIDDAVLALQSLLAGLTALGRPIFLVGFSKGGATIAEMVADWDDGPWAPDTTVVGAALLDPPLATRVHGELQSLGRGVSWIPDDGGYDPVQCSLLVFGCDDDRVNLGKASGVEVLVVRNPDALVTSFNDHPEGLRVYEAAGPGKPDEGHHWAVWGAAIAIAAAHEAVLHDRRVAECLVAELAEAGTCALPRADENPPLPSLVAPRLRHGQLVL